MSGTRRDVRQSAVGHCSMQRKEGVVCEDAGLLDEEVVKAEISSV
jgi:hypothetical protein